MLPGLLLQRTGIIITDTDSKKTQKEANPVSRISHTFRSKIAGGKRLPAGAVETGDYQTMEFAGLLGVGRRKEKLKLERNKFYFFYLLYIIASYMGNGPSCPGGPGQVPLLPWPRAGPGGYYGVAGRFPVTRKGVCQFGIRQF